MTGNMSYTNLALMASEFENALTTQPKFAIATVGASSEESEELLYMRAMEHIQKGLKLDMNSPMQASEHYQSGSELLSRALLLGTASPQRLDEMQRALDMVEERMRFISGANGNFCISKNICNLYSRRNGNICAIDIII
jgi:hypothetical protein